MTSQFTLEGSVIKNNNGEQQPTDEGMGHQVSEEPEQSGSGCRNLFIGCSIVGGVLMALIVGGGLYVYYNLSSWVAGSLKASVESTTLPEDQKKRIKKQIDKLKNKYNEGKIDLDELQSVSSKIVEGPLLKVGVVLFVQKTYFQETDKLNDEEKEKSMRALDRYARGLYEDKISPDTMEQVFRPLEKKTKTGGSRFKEEPSRKVLLKVAEKAREKADENNIPDEEFNVDVASEFEKIVREATKENKADNGNRKEEGPRERKPGDSVE